MTEVPDRVKDPISSPEAQHALCLLRYYGFELDTYTVEEQIAEWLEHYPVRLIVQAIVEALYQGRYKTVSVNQILALWQRRGQTICHFNHEFERLVGGNLPASVPTPSPQPRSVERAASEPFSQSSRSRSQPDSSRRSPTPKPQFSTPNQSYREMLLELPSVRAASKLKRLTEIPTLKLAKIPIASEESSNGTSNNSSLSVSASVEVEDLPPEPELPEVKLPLPEPERLDKPEPDPEREFKEFKEGVIFALSSGLAAQALKPRMRLLLSRLYQIDWLQFCSNAKAIDQFIPALEPSEFHNKLKTVAEPGEAEQE